MFVCLCLCLFRIGSPFVALVDFIYGALISPFSSEGFWDRVSWTEVSVSCELPCVTIGN